MDSVTEAAEEHAEDEEIVEAAPEVKEIVVVKDQEGMPTRVRVKVLERSTPDTRQPDMKICLLISPVDAIGDSGKLHISVRSQGPVHGRITGFPKETNEIQASLKQKKTI